MNHGLLNGLFIVSLTILFLALLLKRAKQPYFIAYIIAGIILGPEVFGVISRIVAMESLHLSLTL